MKKFVQIQNNKAHWIFEAEEKPEFHPTIILIDITGRDDVKEGWDYDSSTGEFIEPSAPEPIEPKETLEDKIARIEETNFILMDALATTYEEIIMLRMQLEVTAK